MPLPTVTEAYARAALNHATVTAMEDGDYVARVPGLAGVVAFGATEREALDELWSVVEDWARFRAKRGRYVPPLDDVDLNTSENRELIQKY